MKNNSDLRLTFTHLVRTFALVAALMSLLGPAVGAQAEDGAAALPGLTPAVLDGLRHGGYVIYFRHAESAPGASDEDAVMGRCDTQRNLSPTGRTQAVLIGRAVAALHIQIGDVWASPFCRTMDTARLAFGKATVDNNLYFMLAADSDETHRLASGLRTMLATPPAAGTNTVIVAHSANLREATGLWPKPEGAAYVFKPAPGGKFQAIARVAPEEWAAAAHLRP
jgi:phosphohistidine phosphatase SixA